MAERPIFAQVLDYLDELNRTKGLRIVTNSGLTAHVTLSGDADQIVPFLIAEGREALRRAAQGEPVTDPAAARALQETD